MRRDDRASAGIAGALWLAVGLAPIHAEGGRPLYPPMQPPFRTIVEEGAARAAIVLPPAPSATHALAAEELQCYLEKISGAEVPVVAATAVPAGQFRLLLGREHAVADTPRLNALKEEGFQLKSGDDYLLCAGREDLGTLWAVYSFLERRLGVRWFMPGDLGEVVPRMATIEVGQIDETEEPDFVFRYVGANDWSRRNRMNGRLFIHKQRLGFNMWGGYHTFGGLLHPSKYFDEHPDWFPEIKGERTKCNPGWAPPQGYTYGNQICTTNPGAIAQVVENIRALLKEDPSIRVVSVGPNDGQGWCECADCRAEDEPDVGRDELRSRRLLVFYNAVAREIPWAIVHTIRRDLPEFKRLGIDGLFTQYSSRNTSTMLLNYYVAAKLLWDADADVDALLADFYEKYYGRAAAPMRQYHELWEQALQDSGKCFPGNGVNAVGVYTLDLLDACDQCLQEARRLADGDTVRRRLHLHELSLDYTRRYLAFKELALAADGNSPEKVAAAVDAGNALVAHLRANRKQLMGAVDQDAELIQYYLGSEIERLMQRRDRQALARFDALEEWVALPDDWRFRLDPGAKGEENGWHQPAFDDSKWRLLKPRRPWHCQGIKYEGTTWFRTTFDAPAKPDTPVFVALAGLKGDATVYLNGEPVLQAAGPDGVPQVDVTARLKFDAANHLALRINDEHGLCGLYGGVKLATVGDEIWLPGAAFTESWVPPDAKGNRPWITTGPAQGNRTK